jgi:hypothetical protein
MVYLSPLLENLFDASNPAQETVAPDVSLVAVMLCHNSSLYWLRGKRADV